jgi:DNA mismatch repair protein MutS
MSTPARRQYLEIKARHQDAILFYQVGDFYETFDDDARIASRELQIVLTGRSYGPTEHVPLAGVPLHALDTYAAKLVARGYTVAICEQVSPPGHGLVKREVTRVLTPGTVAEPAMLVATRDTYLVACTFKHVRSGELTGVGLASIDASTGAFACTQWEGSTSADDARAELSRLAPSEVLIAERLRSVLASPASAQPWLSAHTTVTAYPSHHFDAERARDRLCRHFGTQALEAFGCADRPLATGAAGAILDYVEHVNPTLLRLISGLRSYDTRGFVQIDGATLRTLEVVEPLRGGTSGERSAHTATLLSMLDATRTAMGARLLRRTLLHPLSDRLAIEERLDAVDELYGSPSLRQRLSGALDGLHDLERLVGRVAAGTATAREVYALHDGLAHVPAVIALVRTCEAAGLARLCASLDPCETAQSLIERAVLDPTAEESGLIRPGFDGQLDEMVASSAGARRWIATLETTERQRTGIKSLKVGYNQVFGYYIEVTRPNLGLVPADYQRRQTLSHAERFVTPELKEHEALLLHVQERIADRERALFADVLATLARDRVRLRATAEALAEADVLLALATIAVARGYVRPQLTDSAELDIVAGRHPTVEAAVADAFIANDTHMGTLEAEQADTRLLLLTGPNMAGKSTYLRQVAAIVLLAQAGSFVPAACARIGIVDRIFSRVGADDDLARGMSTFMLEMVETAYILRHATPRSLVILDEVGRGTSTRDGLAIARAVVEHLHTATRARTLFATHFHELASLADALPSLRVYQMEVTEQDGEAVFLHRVVPGASGHSYGVQVARMAGVPGSVTLRAAQLLADDSVHLQGRIADGSARYVPVSAGADGRPPEIQQRMPAASVRDVQVESAQREVALALASLNIAAMTPLEALNVLFSLQQRALAAVAAGGG